MFPVDAPMAAPTPAPTATPIPTYGPVLRVRVCRSSSGMSRSSMNPRTRVYDQGPPRAPGPR